MVWIAFEGILYEVEPYLLCSQLRIVL